MAEHRISQGHTVGQHRQDAQDTHHRSLKERLNPLLHFWQKLSNDWIFNLSGLLAYNFLMSIFPILLALLAVAGFIFNAVSPGAQQQLTNAIANAFPGGSSGTGGVVVKATVNKLQQQAGVLFIIGLVTSIFTGSRLFITLENCFGIIFRLRGRDLLRQNLMAIGMLLLYMVLVPVVFLASIVPTAIVNSLQGSGKGSPLTSLVVHAIGIGAAFVVALALFAAIYVVVPNRPVRLKEVWKGTLTAAGLLVLYELLFPIYESVALKPNSYGSVAAFAIVILIFFYYLAVILLLGAEVNSWASGQRQTASDIAAILHEVQAHNTTRGAGGPTAGSPQEDLEHQEGAPAMADRGRAKEHERTDHRHDVQPASVHPGRAVESRSTDRADDNSQRDARDAQATDQGDGYQRDGHQTDGATATASGARTSGETHSAPFALQVGPPQMRHSGAAPAAAITPREPPLTRPVAPIAQRETQQTRQTRQTERVVGIAVAAGVAALAFWLQRRR